MKINTVGRGCMMAVVLLAAMAVRANAQVNLTGYWDPLFSEDVGERIAGPEIGDYLGLPINAADRQRADTWDAEILTLPEHQCKPHPSTYGFRGIGLLRIWADVDPTTQEVVKFNTHIEWMEQERQIWMDGRPHPPEYAAHTWQGFSTGHWEGNTLVAETTHLKAGWIRRNGVVLSDRATMEDRFIRHGDLLTHVSIVSDPVYLTEPFVRTNGFRLNLNAQMRPYPCESVEEIDRPQGVVPHYLPGSNPYLMEFANRHHLPFAATRGGAETAYPEYMKTLRATASEPAPGRGGAAYQR
jgi:hypothetical protein